MHQLLIGLTLCAMLVACHQSPPSPQVLRLQKSLTDLENSLAQLEDKAKTAPPENQNTLHQERELIKSRLERVREQLKAADPKGSTSTASPASSH
jgi:ABC-type uncharacterized transport system auxiliary subunit